MTTHVLVTSDTHVSDASRLPAELLEAASRAHHIVHAGDHSSADVVDVLAAFAPVTAVYGNVEEPEVVARLPELAFVVLEKVRIGVIHIGGPAQGRHARLAGLLPECDVRVYGHSHMPEVARLEDGSMVLNPGSPTQRRRSAFHSFAWLEINEREISANLIKMNV
jgi:uncharacterized protein